VEIGTVSVSLLNRHRP